MLGEVAKANPGKDVFAVNEIHITLPDELKETTIQALGRSLAKAGAIRDP